MPSATNSPPAIAEHVLLQRLFAGSELCRSGHFTQISSAISPAMLALDQLVCFLLRLESIFRQLQRFRSAARQIAAGNRETSRTCATFSLVSGKVCLQSFRQAAQAPEK